MNSAFLDSSAEAAVRQRAAAVEKITGVEVVAAVTARADSYPEIPWKAFALGASLGAAAAVATALLEPGWDAAEAVVETVVAVLASGGVIALATIWIAPLARLFVPRARREAEVLQSAQAMFLESGLTRTRRRDGILVLVSLFEREVVVLADIGLQDRLAPTALAPVIAAITARLKRGQLRDALEDGLARLEETLVARGFRPQAGDTSELSDAVIQRRGPS
ncbi:MAG TPA: TPM domain-containing protein [Burkholderiales bacterium]|nr:TPM domain-containing protein [Burkholderiales bacterium]